MSEMIRPSFEKMAFIGEKARDARFVSRVDATKDKLNVALNPIDPVAERRMNGNASAVVKGLAESGEWSCESVKSLVETVSDPTRSANRDIAKERLDVLATSTYIVMTHGENEALRQAVGTKDGAVIDAALPESLRGIGGRVAEIATEQEITDPKLKEALKKLDRRADVLRASGSVGEEKLKELIGDKILELSELVDDLDDRGYEELTRVSAYLGAEADRLNVEVTVDEDDRVVAEEEKKRAKRDDEEIESILAEKELWKFDESETFSEDDTPEERREKERKREIKIDRWARKSELFRSLIGNKAAREKTGYRERKENVVYSITEVRQILTEIENTGRDVSDLSLNSHKFTYLNNITIDINDGVCKAVGEDGVLLKEDELKELSREIKMRLFLNDLFLATSDVRDIEGISKVMTAFHKGDTERSWDKEYVSFFLKDGANGLQVERAWNMRQFAYFSYGGVDKRNGRVVDGGNGLLHMILRDRPDLIDQYIERYTASNPDRVAKMKKKIDDTEKDPDVAARLLRKKLVDRFLGVSLLMSKNEEYGIHRDYFTNLRNDLDLDRKEIVKLYMVDKLISGAKGKKVTREDAESAFELARKLSVATYTDSAANIAFADGDDYSELILFKFLRYQDGVEIGVEVDDDGVEHRKPAKNKPVGSVDTIKYIDTLTPPWLATLTYDGLDGRGMWKPLRASDIDISKLNPKSESTYHFGSIILKKAQEAKMALMTHISPKDVMETPDKFQKTYERLSKTMAEATKAGWQVIDTDFFGERPEGMNEMDYLVKAQDYFRFVYTMGVLERATKSSLYGWTREAYDEFEKLMMRSGMLVSEDGGLNETFITEAQLDWLTKRYNARKMFGLFESIQRSKKRGLI